MNKKSQTNMLAFDLDSEQSEEPAPATDVMKIVASKTSGGKKMLEPKPEKYVPEIRGCRL